MARPSITSAASTSCWPTGPRRRWGRSPPLTPGLGLGVRSFATIPAALDRLAEIVATGPVAVEMLDRMILELAARNPLYSHYLDFTAAGALPAAVLAAQFYSDTQDELADR